MFLEVRKCFCVKIPQVNLGSLGIHIDRCMNAMSTMLWSNVHALKHCLQVYYRFYMYYDNFISIWQILLVHALQLHGKHPGNTHMSFAKHMIDLTCFTSLVCWTTIHPTFITIMSARVNLHALQLGLQNYGHKTMPYHTQPTLQYALITFDHPCIQNTLVNLTQVTRRLSSASPKSTTCFYNSY